MELALVPKHLRRLAEEARVAAPTLGCGIHRGQALAEDTRMDMPGRLIEPQTDPRMGGPGAILRYAARLPARG